MCFNHLDLGIHDKELDSAIIDMKCQAWEVLLRVCGDEVGEATLLDKLRRRFEANFRYDEKGIPRIWKPADDIDTLYSASKLETESILDLLSKIAVEVDQIDTDITSAAVLYSN